MHMPEGAHSVIIEVQPEHIDILDHVNNVVYLGWVQEVAISHWTVLAPLEMQQAMFWVVRRHEIEYLRPAFLGETLVVTTWIGREVDGYFERFTHIARQSDGAAIVEVLSLWCPMDMGTGRRIREIPQDVLDLCSVV